MSLLPEPVNVSLFEKRIFTDIIKNLKMKSAYIIWVGSKSRDEGRHNRKAEGELTQTTEEAHREENTR